MEVSLTPLALAERGFTLFADRPAVVSDGRVLSYRDLLWRVERLAGGLRGLGVHDGDRIALLAPNTLEALECYTGVPLAGGVLVPLNTRLSLDEYLYILDHCGAGLLLVDVRHREMAERIAARLPGLRVVLQGGIDGPDDSYEAMLGAATPVRVDAEAVDERAIITINYTSGTTARPKGVMLTHRNACLNAVNMLIATGLQTHDVHLHVAPMFHANGWGFVWATLAVGALNVTLPRVQPQEIYRKIAEHHVTGFCAAPTVLAMLLQSPPDEPPQQGMRVKTAGAAPPVEIIRRIEDEFGWRIQHLYGLTETTAFLTSCEVPPDVAAASLDERARFKGRQGIALPLAGRVRVVRPDMSDVAPDGQEMGEVVARGNVVMSGYYRDRDATEQAFSLGWFHTGDLAVMHPDGYIEIRDRQKDVIISGGENVPSLEVEGVLYQHPDVAMAAVVAAPDPLWGETPVAFVVPRPGHKISQEDITRFCRERLSHFKVPRRVVTLPELPRTGSGKVQKYLLRLMAREPGPMGAEDAVEAPVPKD